MTDAALSKSAKQRLAKKARDEKAAAEAAAAAAVAAPPPAPPAPAAPAAAKAKATNGYASAKAAAAAPVAPKKAAAPEPSADGWTESKSKSKKGKPSPAVAPAPPPADPEDPFTQYDDGTGGDWEVCTSTTSKKKERHTEKQKEADLKKQAEEREAAQAEKDAAYRAKKAEKKAAKNGTAVPEPAPVVPAAPAPGAKEVRPSVAASIAKVAAEAKAAAAKAAAGQAEKPKPKPAPAADAEEKKPEEPDNTIVVTVQVPEEKIGVVIGPKGARVREIEEKTGVVINTNKSTFTIRAEPEKVPAAEKAIKDLISKGYMELSWEDFAEASVMVYASRVPDLIGKGGETIRQIKEKLNVEINVQKTAGAPKGNKGQKIKVDIAGNADSVNKCKECISSIMMFYHHEITHPCAVHEELEVQDWARATIIGKNGENMRHLQNDNHVKIYIPRDGETDNKNVVIVGGSADAKKTKQIIEKWISEAEAKWNDKSKKEEN